MFLFLVAALWFLACIDLIPPQIEWDTSESFAIA